MSDPRLDKLGEAFAPEMLRTNKDKGNLTYVPVSEVIARLNSIVGFEWSYEVLDRWASGQHDCESGTYPMWCMAHVRLTIYDGGSKTATRDGVGGQQVKFLRSNAGPVDMGDEWKGAVSDALKKAAQSFGVALDLARKEEAKNHEQNERAAAEAQRAVLDRGWESRDEYDARLSGLKARAKALDDDARASISTWWSQQGFEGALTVDQADLYEEKITELEPADQLAASA